jgi:hypothetical protein
MFPAEAALTSSRNSVFFGPHAVAGVVPDVHAESKIRLGFHGQVRLDSSWPVGIYTPMLLRRVAFPPLLRTRLLRRSDMSPTSEYLG